MTHIVEPKPAFRGLTEAQVLQELDDPDPENPIALEVARLIEGYTANFKAHVERLGSIPTAIIHLKGRWPIEAVAIRLTTEALRRELAAAMARKG